MTKKRRRGATGELRVRRMGEVNEIQAPTLARGSLTTNKNTPENATAGGIWQDWLSPTRTIGKFEGEVGPRAPSGPST